MTVPLTLLDQGATTTDGAVFPTASVAPAADRTLLLFVVGGSNNAGNNVEPTSADGLGLTWTNAGTVINDYVRGTLFTARTGSTAPTPGAVTITHPSSILAFHWHLIAADAAATLPQAPATYTGVDQNPAWSLTSAPAADSATVQLAVMNSNTATIGTTGGYSLVGAEQVTTTTNVSSEVQVADPATQACGFTSTAAAPRKVGLTVELAPATVTPPPATPSIWYKTGGTRRPLTARSHTRRTVTGGGTGDLAGWTLHYETDFTNLTGWDVKNGQTQSNDNSVNIAANVVPASVSGGTGLTIYGRRESNAYGVPYTSGEIYGTGSMVVPNYFRAEVVGTIMDESGLWPCLLWFRPHTGGDGSNGEIDVMEYMGGRSENLDRKRVAVTQHNEYGGTQDSIKKPIYFDQLTDPTTTALHKYTIEKVPGSITIWIDDDTHQSRVFSAADKTWWDRIMEAADRTWYARITLQIGSGASTVVVPEPAAGWTESAMTVRSLTFWTMA